MKKTSVYIVLLVSIAALSSACVKKFEPDINDMRIRIGANISSSVIVSKSATPYIDYDYGEELAISVLRWDEGETVKPSELTPMDATLGKPSNNGEWIRKITFESGNTQFYNDRQKEVGFTGWYPRESDSWVKDASDKMIHDDGHMEYLIDGQTDVMVSSFEKGTFTTGINPLMFSHALCMYNIYAYAVDNETRDEWGKLTEVTITNLPQKLIITWPEDITSGKPVFSFEDGTKQTISILSATSEAEYVELHAGFPSSGEGLIGTVLCGSPNDGIIGIIAKTSEHNSGNSVSIARNFKPGYSYNIFLRFSSKGIVNAEVSASEWQYDGNETFINLEPDVRIFTDLSRYGTANSYIVSSANLGYCFDGTVKGNGVNTLTDSDGRIIELPDRNVNLDVDSVRIIRSDAMMKLVGGKMTFIEDYNERVNTPIIELASNKLSEGKVLFTVPGNPDNPDDFTLQYRGNVKIGAYKNGELVWSWHIWVTDKPYNQGYANGYSAMDRNLGAVTTDHSTFQSARSQWSGLYYQWGRKDAIFRPTVDYNPDWDYIWPRNVKPATSLQEIHKDPTAYYYTEGNQSWTTDTENQGHFWGYVGPWDNYVKTLYDPCPPGYRVPENLSWHASEMATKVSKLVNATNEFAGYRFSLGDMINIYYPGTVCLAEGVLKNSDDKSESTLREATYLSSSTPYINSEGIVEQQASYHFSYMDGRDVNSVLISDPVNYHTEWTAAYPVRCILESSSPTVDNLSKSQTANSYMVSKSGFYKFRATIRGNGVTGLNIYQNGNIFFRAFDAGMGSAITGIDRVDILWWQGDLKAGSDYRTFAESNPSPEEIDEKCPVKIINNGSLKDDYAMFYAVVDEKNYGNVGLAAYDVNGKILWTWHIWIQPGTFVVNLGDYTVMDRNLGATFAPSDTETIDGNNLAASFGMYYQWGRKDPFFPPASQSTTGNDTYYWFEKTSGGWVRRSENTITGKSSIQASVENPLRFFSSSNTFWQTTYTNYKGEANDFWGYVGSAGSIGESFAKTMYDPCPPGYKVMQHNVFLSANICQSDYDTPEYNISNSNISVYAYAMFLNQDMSTTLGSIKTSGIWFPNAPAIIGSSGYFSGASGPYRLSTATPFYTTTGGEKLNTREMRWNKNGNRYKAMQNNSYGMADARVVRCQME